MHMARYGGGIIWPMASQRESAKFHAEHLREASVSLNHRQNFTVGDSRGLSKLMTGRAGQSFGYPARFQGAPLLPVPIGGKNAPSVKIVGFLSVIAC